MSVQCVAASRGAAELKTAVPFVFIETLSLGHLFPPAGQLCSPDLAAQQASAGCTDGRAGLASFCAMYRRAIRGTVGSGLDLPVRGTWVSIPSQGRSLPKNRLALGLNLARKVELLAPERALARCGSVQSYANTFVMLK